MNDTNDGGPAFPASLSGSIDTASISGCHSVVLNAEGGMSLRDWFAGQAVAGMMTGSMYLNTGAEVAKAAYAIADAMLQQREGAHT